jgi:hypothetical protein
VTELIVVLVKMFCAEQSVHPEVLVLVQRMCNQAQRIMERRLVSELFESPPNVIHLLMKILFSN